MPPPVTLCRFTVLLIGGIEMLLGLTQPGGSIAHIASLGGLLGGWLIFALLGSQPPFKRGGGS